MSKNIILDSSALLALIKEESAAEVIKPLLKHTIMSAVNVAEAVLILQQFHVQSQESLTLITDIIGNIMPFDTDQAIYIANLEPQVQNKSLSLGDKICIALGIKLQVPVYTTNTTWLELSISNVDIKVMK